MSTVAVYFNQPGKLDYPLDQAKYYIGYADLTAYFARRGIDIVITRGNDYLGDMRFGRGWRFVDGELIDIADSLSVDLIYNKELDHDLVVGPGDSVINDPVFDKLGRDKWLTYQAFSHMMAQTVQITNENWHDAVRMLNSDKIVLKPTAGTEGRGIIITDKVDLDFPSLELIGPYLVQEFIDSSSGIPGVCDGLHDLRILLFDGAAKLAFVRQPQPGKLLANTAQGGSLTVVDVTKVPASALALAREIDNYYAQYPNRVYAADFFFQDGRPYLIETNTRPGIFRRKDHGDTSTEIFYDSLLAVFLRAISSHTQG